MACSGMGGLGQCRTTGRWNGLEAYVALGLEIRNRWDRVLGEQVIVVWDCATIG